MKTFESVSKVSFEPAINRFHSEPVSFQTVLADAGVVSVLFLFWQEDPKRLQVVQKRLLLENLKESEKQVSRSRPARTKCECL